jgi:hypothetical protein
MNNFQIWFDLINFKVSESFQLGPLSAAPEAGKIKLLYWREQGECLFPLQQQFIQQ